MRRYARSGLQIDLPDTMYDRIGNVFVDAEIWYNETLQTVYLRKVTRCGRGSYSDAQKLLTASLETVEIALLRY